MIVDCVIPARDEAATVATVVGVARACRYIRKVVVVDDGSVDATAAVARAAGATVVRRDGSNGSKAHAMEVGVEATGDADAVLFVDADLIGVSPAHLDDICRPVVEHRAAMSLGTFDYGPFWNPL